MTVPIFVAAAQSRDEAALRATLASTFTGTANGRPIDAEGQVALIRSWWTGFPEGTLTMEAVGGHGRYVITWKVAGPHGGDYLGIPATGRPVEISGFTTARSDAAGIQEMAWKWDTKTFVRSVLGPEIVLPPPPPVPKRHLIAPWEQGQRGPQRMKGKGGRPQGGPSRGRQRLQPEGGAAATGQADAAGQPVEAAQPGQPGQPGEMGQPRPKRERRRGRQRRGQVPEGETQPDAPLPGKSPPPAAPAEPTTPPQPAPESSDAPRSE